MAMRLRTIGNETVGRVQVGAIGLGLMTFDQSGTQSRHQLADTVRAALDAGVTLFDSADAYGPGEERGAGAQGAGAGPAKGCGATQAWGSAQACPEEGDVRVRRRRP